MTFVHQNEGLTQQKDADDDEESDDDDDKNDDDDNGTLQGNNNDDNNPDTVALSPQVVREYIARTRKHNPVMPPEVAPYVVEAYVSLRMQNRPGARSKKESDQTVMTARQLLSILRLSQALARLRFSDFVAREDVDEAIRLTHMSKATLLDEQGGSGNSNNRKKEDGVSRIFNIIRDYASVSETNEVELTLVGRKLPPSLNLRMMKTKVQGNQCQFSIPPTS